MIYTTRTQLMDKAVQAEGRTFGEIDKSGRIKNGRSKGQLGQIVEESFFEYKINSNSEADFSELGIELKVTAVRTNKNGTLSAKERLVLNIINYINEIQKDFEKSSFWVKNKELLIMFYEWLPDANRSDYRIIKSYLHQYTAEDLEIIKQDWEIINEKIKNGLAHELSEADTNYLAASTKGASGNSLRVQPNSDLPAMQRAYSLKQSYMTTLVRKIISKEDLSHIASSIELRNKSLLDILYDKFNQFIGKSLDEISNITGIKANAKSNNFLQIFVSSLLGIQGTKLDNIDEFAKANIRLKTVRLEPNGIPEQHMSFKNIDFHEWASETWDESWLNNYFLETKLLFVVFEYKEPKPPKGKKDNRELYFKGIKLWNMPVAEIEGRIKEFFYQVKNLIINGIVLTPTQQKNRVIVKNNLPKPNSNNLCHLRPKGNDGSDKVSLPDGRMIGKQAFWLDREFISKLMADNFNV